MQGQVSDWHGAVEVSQRSQVPLKMLARLSRSSREAFEWPPQAASSDEKPPQRGRERERNGKRHGETERYRKIERERYRETER